MTHDLHPRQEYWRSLDQLADTPEFRQFVEREFPAGASELNDPLTRRKFISLMGASMAMAGLAGCRRPVEKIIPYVNAPEEIVPGVAQYYATTMPFGADAFGLIVESHEGRPTKIEGNPKHPSTMGKSNTFVQASILNLYDPDRSNSPLNKGAEATWDDFVTYWRGLLAKYAQNGGTGLAVLTESFASPTMVRLASEFRKTYPKARWASYETVSDEDIFAAAKDATGKEARPVYHFDKAKVILSLDSDFVYLESDNIRNAAGFAAGRRVTSENDDMNRLYAVECDYSLTGAMADHRQRIARRRVGEFAAALVAELRAQGLSIEADLPSNAREFDAEWIKILASDLIRAGRDALVVAGRSQPPFVHLLAFMINNALGSIGNTLVFQENETIGQSRFLEMASLTGEMKSGKIETLVIFGGNPMYDAPVDLDFTGALSKVPHTVHLSQRVDETSSACEWHLPEAHYLEAWGDARSYDGTRSIIQPLIAPLLDGRSQIEVLNLIVTGDATRGYDLVRDSWKGILPGLDFESRWRKILNDGFLEGNSQSSAITTLDESAIVSIVRANDAWYEAPSAQNLEINFAPSRTVYDGRFANNGWLQEASDPLTKITWDNAALLSPATAKELGLKEGEVVRLEYSDHALEMPVWVMPGHADYSVTLPLGYGRKAAGRVGNDVGFDTYKLRTARAPFYDLGLKISKTGRSYILAQTQNHGAMEGRPIVREATLEHYREHPNFAPEMVEAPKVGALWDEHKFTEGYQWGMAIDLNVCIGCNACNVACYSENNIPVVGKEEVHNAREMPWIRVDRYFTGEPDDPGVVHQPVPCMHCENAPCEQVCPVNAALHNSEGLNLQVYNRCIGTRYCSNNCPYKVRRFNFFNYTSKMPELVKMAMNPDVTVRSRGVMEKCTYCIQRIEGAKIAAKKEDRNVRDGEIVTACAQACPTDAIVFGNVNDSESRVSKVKAQNRNYGMLVEYNTRPRTTYQARIRNPHPDLELWERKRASKP